MVIKFTDLDAFVEELRKDRFKVERRIVRVTRAERPSSRGAVNVVLLAFAKINDTVASDLLKLEYFVGQIWPKYPEYSTVTERNFAEAKQRLEQALADLNLEVRDGIVEDAD